MASQHFTISPPRARIGDAADAELARERHRLDKRQCVHPEKGAGYVDGVYIDGFGVVMARWWSDGKYDPVRAARLEPVGGVAA